jgi:hypothetical protein
MSKAQALQILKTLSAIEAVCLSATGKTLGFLLPDYLHDDLTAIIDEAGKVLLDEAPTN